MPQTLYRHAGRQHAGTDGCSDAGSGTISYMLTGVGASAKMWTHKTKELNQKENDWSMIADANRFGMKTGILLALSEVYTEHHKKQRMR